MHENLNKNEKNVEKIGFPSLSKNERFKNQQIFNCKGCGFQHAMIVN